MRANVKFLHTIYFLLPLRLISMAGMGFLASIFEMDDSSIQRVVTKFVDVLSSITFKHMVTAQQKIIVWKDLFILILFLIIFLKRTKPQAYSFNFRFVQVALYDKRKFTAAENIVYGVTKQKYPFFHITLDQNNNYKVINILINYF